MKQTVFGIFDNIKDAEKAVEKLLSSGFSNGFVDIHNAKENTGTEKGKSHKNEGISNFFNSLFSGNKQEAKTYSDVASRGVVVTVHATSKEEADQAAKVLDEYGAIDANERALQYRQELDVPTDTTAGTEESIPVIEEEMEVGKREVVTGSVRVRSRIVERPVEEKLRLREEHVTVDRKPVNRPATEADFQNVKEGELELTEHEEVPVVNKEARVVEEVELKKEAREREEKVRDRVRATEVDVKKTQKEKDINRKE